MNKTQPIEQWMTDAAKEWFGDDIEFATKLRRIIACHYHASRAAQEKKPQEETPKESIWRPVEGATLPSGKELHFAGVGHKIFYCTETDLLALAPLPKEQTQEEKDEELIESLAAQYAAGQFSQQDFYRKLVEAGRATAKEGDK